MWRQVLQQWRPRRSTPLRLLTLPRRLKPFYGPCAVTFCVPVSEMNSGEARGGLLIWFIATVTSTCTCSAGQASLPRGIVVTGGSVGLGGFILPYAG